MCVGVCAFVWFVYACASSYIYTQVSRTEVKREKKIIVLTDSICIDLRGRTLCASSNR